MVLKAGWMMAVVVISGLAHNGLPGQAVPAVGPVRPGVEAATYGQIEQRMQTMADQLTETQRQLDQARLQMQVMQTEMSRMRQQIESAKLAVGRVVGTSSSVATLPPGELTEVVTRLGEEIEAQQAEIHQHEQIKVETESKYGLKVYGLVLFNAFSNAGQVDNIDLPSLAAPRTPGASHGTVGGTVRQTILGLRATGPTLFHARTSADLSTDFFSSIIYDYYGNSTGTLRLRRVDFGLDWKRDALHAGVDGPLISPLSPTSYATVGVPALGWAGNLWSWSTQVRYSHTQKIGERQSVELEAGLWDAPVIGVGSIVNAPVPTPGELSRQPGVEGRASYHWSRAGQPLVLGVGAYTGRENYDGTDHLSTWALTGDWQIPVTRAVSISGEIYRGVGLGGFGGGAYKDLLTGIDPVTNRSKTIGLNAVGGWSQLKVKLPYTLELNGAYGQDGGFAADLRSLDLSASTYYLELSARNRMIFGNIIYRPKTYLILSPEYRRIESWQTTGPARIANIFTLSAGYQF